MGLDIVGPLEAFDTARIETPDQGSAQAYDVVIAGMTGKPFVSSSGISFVPHVSLRTLMPVDTLIIPGGSSVRLDPATTLCISSWIRSNAKDIRRIASVCTGIYALAPTGLLDGKRVTTHWQYAADLARRFPKLKVDPDAVYLGDGHVYTSAGVTAGIDLALGLIEEDFGSEVALSVARYLVVYLKRSGGQEQYSDPLRLQIGAADQFSSLTSWMMANLRGDLSVEALAARVSLSRRHFTRSFRKAFGTSPADYVDSLRLDEARTLLSVPHASIEEIAAAVGFGSSDVFRRAFVRRFGISPSSYRGPFGLASAG